MGLDRFGGRGAGGLRPGRRAVRPRRPRPPPMAAVGASSFSARASRPGWASIRRRPIPRCSSRRSIRRGSAFVAVNAGVSGETSAGARRRIDWLLREPAAVLVIETGANDGLRGLDVDSLAANIQAIVDRARQQSPPPRIVLVGMAGASQLRVRLRSASSARSTPSWPSGTGCRWCRSCSRTSRGWTRSTRPDMMHPTAAGQRRVAETVWPVLEKVLRGTG